MKRPNILIFMTDQQRGDTVYPYSRAKMPNIERFAAEGVSFKHTCAPSPHCCPSRASFFSGCYPSRHGVWNNVSVGNALTQGLYDGITFFSEKLKEHGYDMYYSGKWHVSNFESPADRGFKELIVNCMPQRKREDFNERPSLHEWEFYVGGVDEKTPDERGNGEILRPGYGSYIHYGANEEPFNDGEIVDAAVKKIVELKGSDVPWCIYVGPSAPHDPYFVPKRFLDQYQYETEQIELPKSFYDKMEDKPGIYRRTREAFDQLTEQEHKEAIKHYLAFCSYEDELFGEVLESLEKSGQADDTLVLFLSDHGDYMGEHGLWCKGLPCFNSAYHIPAVVRWKNGIKNPGRVVEEFVSLTDFAPTILEVTGIETDAIFTGESLAPFLKDQTPVKWRKEIFTQSNGNELYGIQRSVMTAKWKYVYNGYDYDELYNLEEDPEQICNLISQPEYNHIVKEMCKKLWEFAYSQQDVCINRYVMVAHTPFGPGIAFEE